MKLLFDQNLSYKLVEQLVDLFPGSVHVRSLGMGTASDLTVWAHAKASSFLIVSKDADFQQRAILYGHPPKVIWVRLGNCQTSFVAALLRARFADVVAFESDLAASFLALS